MARPTKVMGVALAELVRVLERSQGRLVESGITQVRRIKLAQDNGPAKAGLSAQTGAPGNSRGHGIEREAEQGVASTIPGVHDVKEPTRVPSMDGSRAVGNNRLRRYLTQD
jgi:hypothetical protein